MAFASVFVHVNDDKLLDLFVVNDSTPNQLYINKGDGTFEEIGYPVRHGAQRERARAGGHGPRRW